MRWVLDTSAFSAVMKQDGKMISLLKEHQPRNIVTVPPTVAEIQYGLHRIRNSTKKFLLLNAEKDRLLSVIAVLPWIPESSFLFGKIKSDLEQGGEIIDDFDVAIGAIALSHGCGVITANLKHFNRIKDLDCKIW
jgi:predicted nucleic acid-binding protein